MAWYASCDRCGVMSLSGTEPNVPENWVQLRSGRLYCDGATHKSDCSKVGWRAFRRQKPSPADRAMQAVYGRGQPATLG